MFAIAGVTGNTGHVVAETLLAAGAPVRVIVRDPGKGEAWRARGAEVAVADLADRDAVTRALTGVEAAYLLVPPQYGAPDLLAAQRVVVESLAAAAARAKLPHAVLLSSVGAQHAAGTGPIRSLHHAEAALGEVTALTAIRAAYFMENWLGSLGLVDQGLLPTFTPAAYPFAMVATRDIGRVAAGALREGARGRQIIELAGPREYAPADVAAEVAAITGKPIAASEAPLDAVVPTLTSFGMSANVAGLFREMYEGAIAGRLAWEGGGARAVRGSVPIADVLRPALTR